LIAATVKNDKLCTPVTVLNYGSIKILAASKHQLLKTLIVDDESLARRGLAHRLKKIADIEVIGEARNGREALELIKQKEPDLVFLDIQMPGVSGFEVVRQLDVETMPIILFLTAYDEYAVQAFEVNALDYILKPIDEERLHQVLEIFTNSRVPIAALTLGTAVGAFDLAVKHMQKRKIFGKNILNFQAKTFEVSDFYAKLESARLMLYKACWLVDRGKDFRQVSSMAKYLSVEVAREVTLWAADIFGAASVIREHPIHKYPMDVWGSSLGEGTQDVQKLIIFRELMKRYR